MDLKAFAAGEVPITDHGFGGITNRDFSKPLIAAANGSALAGGFEIMISCDMVVAADHAKFGIPEATRGLIAGAGGLIRLPKRVPLAVAYEMALTADPIDAAARLRTRARQSRRARRPGARRRDRAGRADREERAARRAHLQARHATSRSNSARRTPGRSTPRPSRDRRERRRAGGGRRLRREARAELAGQVVSARRRRTALADATTHRSPEPARAGGGDLGRWSVRRGRTGAHGARLRRRRAAQRWPRPSDASAGRPSWLLLATGVWNCSRSIATPRDRARGTSSSA